METQATADTSLGSAGGEREAQLSLGLVLGVLLEEAQIIHGHWAAHWDRLL